jgi:thymidine phosphorylase
MDRKGGEWKRWWVEMMEVGGRVDWTREGTGEDQRCQGGVDIWAKTGR